MTPPGLASTAPDRSRDRSGADLPPAAGRPPRPRGPGTAAAHRGPAIGVRQVPAPAWAPPFDDELADPDPGAARGGHLDQSRSAAIRPVPNARASFPRGDVLALPLPFAAPTATVPRLRLVAAPPAPPVAPAAAWSARFVRVLLETLAGLRPVSQLGAFATADVCRLLARRMGAAARCPDLPRSTGDLRSLHLSSPAEDVAEVCAVVALGGRIRALALRVEGSGGRWRCTELLLG